MEIPKENQSTKSPKWRRRSLFLLALLPLFTLSIWGYQNCGRSFSTLPVASTTVTPQSSNQTSDVPSGTTVTTTTTLLPPPPTTTTRPGGPLPPPPTPTTTTTLPAPPAPLSAGLFALWSAENYGNPKTFAPEKAKQIQFVNGPGSNRYTTSQALGNHYIGRIFSTSGHGSLALWTMDWNLGKLTYVRTFFNPNAASGGMVSIMGGFKIFSAYDPSVIDFQTSTWLAFECSVVDPADNQAIVSTCMGPIDRNTLQLNLDQTYVAIKGNYSSSVYPLAYSSSVPKLVSHQGKLYLYWTVIRYDKVINNAPKDPNLQIFTNGIELVVKNGRFVPNSPQTNTQTWISANSPEASTVFSPAPGDSRSDRAADAFAMESDGTYVYMIAGRGGSGCVDPFSGGGVYSGCYRMSVARSKTALGTGVFNRDLLPDRQLIPNATEYAQFFRRPDGKWMLMLPILNVQKAENRSYPFTCFHSTATPCPPYGYTWAFEVPMGSRTCSGRECTAIEMYKVLLNRTASTTDLTNVVRALEGGQSLISLMTDFYRTSEYQKSLPIDDVSFIKDTHQRLLSRQPTALELEKWTTFLKTAGNTREMIFQSILRTEEFKNLRPLLSF